MKKLLITATFALSAALGYSQNTAWTTTATQIGLGTTSPVSKFDVVSNFTFGPTGVQKKELASFVSGLSPMKIRVNIDNYTSILSGTYSRIESVLTNSHGTTTNRGFLQFGSSSVATQLSAVGFGYNSALLMQVLENGKVKIGDVDTPGTYKLYVEDGILTEKVKVALESTADWADYVFAPDYELMPLEEVETFTKENGHLPNLPSAEEMVANGLDVAQTAKFQQEKIEELTLYLIELKKQVEALKTEIATLKEQKQ